MLHLELVDVVLLVQFLHRFEAFTLSEHALPDQSLSLAHVIFVAHYVMHLVHLHQVNLAQCLLARFAPQAQTTLVAENDLQVVEAPRDELPWQALVFALTDLSQKAVMKNVLVIRRKPDIVLLLLHFAEDQQRI